MMRWFGLLPFANMCGELPRVATPLGEICVWCQDPIEVADGGIYFSGSDRPQHYACFIRQLVGSVGHQRHRCSCFGGAEDDPVGVSRRAAAEAALFKWLETRAKE